MREVGEGGIRKGRSLTRGILQRLGGGILGSSGFSERSEVIE
jgi:hypothetical protein